jgi:ABC-type transporter Mla subunit MlaD
MRTTVFAALGLLELAVAVVLFSFGWSLPSGADVEDCFTRVERVTQRTGDQVRLLQSQVNGYRDPEMQRLAGRFQTQMRRVAGTLRSQTIDFDTVRTMSDSLGDVADGLDSMSATLDPQGLGKLGDGLGATASFLEDQVIPAAAEAAKHLDESTDALRADAKQLAELLRAAPVDLKAVREIHDGLARFSDGLDKMNAALKLQRFDKVREGVKGLEDSLSVGAEQVDRLANFTYPVVTFNGVKPVVERRKFWPEGERIAEGMRKAADGVTAAGKELDGLAGELPKLRESLDESRKVAERSREVLAVALAQQDKVEPLLKRLPEQTARLAESLPQLSGNLGKVLRETGKLKELAGGLRQAQKGVDGAVARWPALRTTLARSATLLKGTQQQLRGVVEHRQDYEKAVGEAVALTEQLADRLPQFTHNLDGQLAQQEEAFGQLGDGIDEVSASLPVYSRAASRLVQTTLVLLWLVAGAVGLHGLYLVAGCRQWLGRPACAAKEGAAPCASTC